MNILILDGHNLMHRARSGFQLGNFNVVYNFFRGLKPLIEQFKPTRVYFTLEGQPKRQEAMLETYKANRVIDVSTEAGEKKFKSLADFHRQKDDIVGMLCTYFPVSVVQHDDFEADDLIYNVIKNASSAIQFTVVSTDTDFIQLLQQFENVKLYNPVTKDYVSAPDYDYVTWKALRGDGSDNIPAIVTEGEALALMDEPERLKAFFKDDGMRALFSRNYELIHLKAWDEEETKLMRSSSPNKCWDDVKWAFGRMEFKSMTKESYWSKFVATFDPLWG